jgi:uncharacterized protein (TIGR00290 family)
LLYTGESQQSPFSELAIAEERSSRNAAVLWTGGKDSALAHYEAVRAGFHVTRLATFAPPSARFLAHPIEVMAAQAEALGLPHTIIEIAEPYAERYEAAIRSLRDDYHIGVLVTGDIDLVGGEPNWVRERAASTGVEVVTPLWDCDRTGLLRRLLSAGFTLVFSCVKHAWLGPEWLGREITWETLGELRTISAATGLDLCGENGEFHSLTLNGPLFRHPIHLTWSPEHTDEMSWLRIERVGGIG